MIRVTRHPWRCYVYGHRVHHFWLGLALIVSDVRDWRIWVADLRNRIEP